MNDEREVPMDEPEADALEQRSEAMPPLDPEPDRVDGAEASDFDRLEQARPAPVDRDAETEPGPDDAYRPSRR